MLIALEILIFFNYLQYQFCLEVHCCHLPATFSLTDEVSSGLHCLTPHMELEPGALWVVNGGQFLARHGPTWWANLLPEAFSDI